MTSSLAGVPAIEIQGEILISMFVASWIQLKVLKVPNKTAHCLNLPTYVQIGAACEEISIECDVVSIGNDDSSSGKKCKKDSVRITNRDDIEETWDLFDKEGYVAKILIGPLNQCCKIALNNWHDVIFTLQIQLGLLLSAFARSWKTQWPSPQNPSG